MEDYFSLRLMINTVLLCIEWLSHRLGLKGVNWFDCPPPETYWIHINVSQYCTGEWGTHFPKRLLKCFMTFLKGLTSSGNPYTLCVIIRWRLVYNRGSNVFMWKGKWVYLFVINTPSGLGFLKFSHGCIDYKKNSSKFLKTIHGFPSKHSIVMLSTVCTISSWQWCQWVFYQTLYQNSHM